MFNIGEFSKIVGLTVKTLRFYHEQELLVPSFVDPQTGYRQYDARQIETARTIAHLRRLEFSLSDIKEILELQGEGDILEIIVRQKAVVEGKIKHLRQARRFLDQFISEERQAIMAAQASGEVGEKTLDPMLVAAIRMKGRYSDCGAAFGKLGRNFGRNISGKPFLLHYDSEYKENDADFEACMPIRQGKAVDGISVRQLAGGRCVALVHKGPYDQLGRSYARILTYVKQKGHRIVMPTREVYLRGPGMIFKGNPKNYLTEIQMLIE
ncbi:MAG: MerR family transcriptional regulator [Tepidisphaeraceae bacterium]|jgi:DNA-binding transcriptional MerR regulator